MTNRGIVPVEVKPTTVPQPNGEMKLGAGAADLSPQQIRVTRVTASRLNLSHHLHRVDRQPALAASNRRSALGARSGHYHRVTRMKIATDGLGSLPIDRVDALPSCTWG
jgi:hypothetical protein